MYGQLVYNKLCFVSPKIMIRNTQNVQLTLMLCFYNYNKNVKLF